MNRMNVDRNPIKAGLPRTKCNNPVLRYLLFFDTETFNFPDGARRLYPGEKVLLMHIYNACEMDRYHPDVLNGKRPAWCTIPKKALGELSNMTQVSSFSCVKRLEDVGLLTRELPIGSAADHWEGRISPIMLTGMFHDLAKAPKSKLAKVIEPRKKRSPKRKK